MLKNFEGARLGIFIFLGTVLLVVAIFLVGNKDSLFVRSVYIKTYFPSVEGLRTGAPVRLSGLSIGTVNSIQLMADTSQQVEVVMRIEKELKRFIRLDSEASIETEGLVGSKLISIKPGSPDQPEVEDNGIIRAKPAISMTEIIEETQATIGYIKVITKEFAEIAEKINNGKGTIGQLINDEQLYYSAVSITNSADTSLTAITDKLGDLSDFILDLGHGVEGVVVNADTAIADIKDILKAVKNGDGIIGGLISDKGAFDSVKTVINNLAQTTNAALSGVQSFSENMEALKHNWLFKGYFEKRGYWDKDEFEKEIDKKISLLNAKTVEIETKLKELKKVEEEFESASSTKK